MEKFTYSSFITGDVSAMLEIQVAKNQTIVAGDLLECVSASGVFTTGEFSKVATALNANNRYCVATSNITTAEETGITTGYFKGYFSESIVLDTSVVSDKLILSMQNIHLTKNRL